jgi:hypothetical protein
MYTPMGPTLPMKWRLDAASHSAGSTYSNYEDILGQQKLELRGSDGSASIDIVISGREPILSADYVCGSTGPQSVELTAGSGTSTANCTIHVARLRRAERVVGTFSATLRRDDGTFAEITDGSFDMPLR